MDAQETFNALLEPAGRDDPYPLYAALHEFGDVIVVGPGLMLVPGYAAASSVLRDPGFKAVDAKRLDQVYPGWRDHPALNAESLLNLNGDDHARIRALFARQFTHRRVQALEPAIGGLTDALLDVMADLGAGGAPVDFMREFAFALPVTVICELIGVPEQHREGFRPLARRLTATLEPFLLDAAGLAAADAAAITLAELFADLVAERTTRPRDDLLSALVAAAAADDAQISTAELIQNLILLLVAGFETTTNLLGNGLRIILSDPTVGDGLRSGQVAAEAFADEVLRYDSPVQYTNRVPTGQAELDGVAVGPGDELVLLLGAANRDPARFADPDEFLPDRADGGPLSFGAGAHFCLGAALARLEGAIAFPRLLRRFGDLSQAGEAERRTGLVLRGFERLPVSLG